jgi:hypothetical protein
MYILIWISFVVETSHALLKLVAMLLLLVKYVVVLTDGTVVVTA